MNKHIKTRITEFLKNKLVPYLLFPAMIGVLMGILIFLFKITSSWVIRVSNEIYATVREEPRYLPILVIGAAAIGVISALILKYAKECRGGGIPTAVASIRGLIPLKWVQGTFVLFGSSLLTYLSGVPLGNEGPSVQMGAALGKASSGLLGKKKLAWERYVMTGGACSGFAIATGAPLSGIMFALEEAHRRFSPAIFAFASISVLAGTVTQELLSVCFGVKTTFFDFTVKELLPLKYLWIAVLIGVMCAVCAILFTSAYRFVKRLEKGALARVPFVLKIVSIFSVTALLGFACDDFIGSGHSLIEKILSARAVWYVLILSFIVRAVLMIVSNSEGVSGGIFVPTLTFGAIIAALMSQALIAVGLIEEQYFAILVVVGMASFLSASSRTPITAITFAAEALCVANNILPVVIGVAVSYLLVEMWGKASFTDTIIESKAKEAREGKVAVIVDAHMTVQNGAFADGMNIRDVLWPPTCVVLSIDKRNPDFHQSDGTMHASDIVHIHYQTYDQAQTVEILTHILGEQPIDKMTKIHLGSDGHVVPPD